MRTSFRRCLLTVIVAVLCAPSAALAQEDGVTVDPDSAAIKEYAIPLEAARRAGSRGLMGRKATPQDAGTGATPSQPPLFGAGVSRRTRGSTGPRAGASTRRSPTGKDSAEGDRYVPRSSAAPVVEAAVKTPAGLWTGGLVAGVLALGALGALGARRWSARAD